jgi:hypothetical protein
MCAVRFATNYDMESDMVDSFLDSVLSGIKHALESVKHRLDVNGCHNVLVYW